MGCTFDAAGRRAKSGLQRNLLARATVSDMFGVAFGVNGRAGG
jgi:hypothetical protein